MAPPRSIARHLPGEVQAWVREGLVSQVQAEAILRRYADARGRSIQFIQVVTVAGAVQLTVGITLIVALCLLMVGSSRRLAKGPEGWALLASFMAMSLVAAAVALAPEAFQRAGRWELALAILIWAPQIAFALCLVWAGALAGRPGWVNVGTFLFALQTITRYFDLFVSMLDTGLLFLLGGALLLGVGYLTERKRRQLLAAMAEGRG